MAFVVLGILLPIMLLIMVLEMAFNLFNAKTQALQNSVDQGSDSIHFENVTNVITKNLMKNLSKSNNKKFKKSVVDTYLLFKLDLEDDFRDIFKVY